MTRIYFEASRESMDFIGVFICPATLTPEALFYSVLSSQNLALKPSPKYLEAELERLPEARQPDILRILSEQSHWLKVIPVSSDNLDAVDSSPLG